MLTQVVEDALAAHQVEPRDAATAELARTYARAIEDGADLAKVGPALLAVLEALGMSPRARNAVKKAVTDDKPTVSPVDTLAERRLRLRPAAPVHPAAEGSQPA